MTQISEHPRDEVMMNVSTEHAFKQAEILAMRQIGDTLTALSVRVEGMATKQDDIKDRLIRIEAQEHKTAILKLEDEFEEYKRTREALKDVYDRRIRAMENIIARWQGLFIPLSIMGAAGLSTVMTLLVNHFVGK